MQVMRMVAREVRMLKIVSHINIVRLIEALSSRGGRAYIVMEHVHHCLSEDLYMHPNGVNPVQVWRRILLQ